MAENSEFPSRCHCRQQQESNLGLAKSAQSVYVQSQGGSVAEWSACLTQVQKARVQIAVATLSGNSFRHTADTHCASVHQAAKLVAALLRVAEVTASLAESSNFTIGFMTRVTCSLTAKNWDQLRNHTLGNRVWATFTFFTIKCLYKSHSA